MDGIGVLVFRVDYSDPEQANDQIRLAAAALTDAGYEVVDLRDPEFLDSLRRSVAVLEGEVPSPDQPPPGW
jgi:hypothetical protein